MTEADVKRRFLSMMRIAGADRATAERAWLKECERVKAKREGRAQP